MKIYVLDSFYPDGVEYAAQRAEVIRWDDPRAGNWHDDADGVMVRVKRIGAEDMARARKLRVISKQGVGLDNIDLAAAKARGIAVCRTPGARDCDRRAAGFAPRVRTGVRKRPCRRSDGGASCRPKTSPEATFKKPPIHRPRQPHQRMVDVDDLIEPGAKQILLARLPPFPWPHLVPRRSLGRLCFGSQF